MIIKFVGNESEPSNPNFPENENIPPLVQDDSKIDPIKEQIEVDYPVAFVWWQRRQHGKTFPFQCPDCDTIIHLRQRVAQSKRACPGCGFKITIEEIDRQLEEMEPERQRIIKSGCGLFLLGGLTFIVVFFSFWFCSK